MSLLGTPLDTRTLAEVADAKAGPCVVEAITFQPVTVLTVRKVTEKFVVPPDKNMLMGLEGEVEA